MAQQPEDADAVGVAQLAKNVRQSLEGIRPVQQLADHVGMGGLFAVVVGQLTVIHVGILPFRPNGNAFRPFGREWGGAVDFWAQGQYTTAMMIKQVLNGKTTGTERSIPMKKTYSIEVDCANCANLMEEAAGKTEGVASAVVNFMTQKMIVEFAEGADVKATMKAVLKACKKVEPDCEIEL